MTNITELEAKILHGFLTSEYNDDDVNGAPWMFSVIEHSGVESKLARGAISSLVKKGIFRVQDYEGKGRTNDMSVSLTAMGKELLSSPPWAEKLGVET